MMKIFVTGVSGMLGTNTVIALLNKGYYVKGITRNPNKILVNHPHFEIIDGDLNNKTKLSELIKDCNAIIHIAALTGQFYRSYSDYEKVNVYGTKNILDASKSKQIKKVVYVSTANVYAYGSISNPGNESQPICKPFIDSYYALSKNKSQELVQLAANDSIDTDYVVVNPTFMIGTYNHKGSSGSIILAGYNKNVVFIPPGGKNFIHVKDVAVGIVNAMEKGKNGESYILSNKNMSYKSFFKLLAQITNKKQLLITLPATLMYLIGLFGDCLRFFQINTSISLNNMRILCTHNYYSNIKATKELKLNLSPIELAIKDSVNWFAKLKAI
jgi:dihydroflavonol-4-reductase